MRELTKYERNNVSGGIFTEVGLKTGVTAGSAVGSMVLPIPVVGTAVGAVVGEAVGGAAGVVLDWWFGTRNIPLGLPH